MFRRHVRRQLPTFDYQAPLRKLAQHPEDLGCLAVFENRGRWDGSNVRLGGDRVLAYRKNPQDSRFDHIDYGALALRRELLDWPEYRAHSELGAIQSAVAERGALRAHVAPTRFYEIGSETGLRELDAFLTEQFAAY
ncbi:MAG: hypothetical protein QM756_08000 [Polyangiaceae bacterium]